MSEPVTGLEEWEPGQSQPSVPVNAMTRALAILAQRVAADIAAAPPGGPVDGACVIVAAAGLSGVFVGNANKIAYYSGGWKFLTPQPGWLFFVADENAYKRYSGTAWVVWSPAFPVPDIEASANRDATPDNSNLFTEFTNVGAKAYTFDAEEDYELGADYHACNAGAGDLTITAANGMVLEPPAGGTLVVPQGGTVTIKIVGVGTAARARVIGSTVAA